MFLWNKKDKRPAWRDASGHIVCTGNACPKNCDRSCPIWLNTVGLEMFQRGDLQGAIIALKAAIEIAPDFQDAFNNLGAAYGTYEVNPRYAKAIYGLIISTKNLGMYDEALHYCDIYEQLGGDALQQRQAITRLVSAAKH